MNLRMNNSSVNVNQMMVFEIFAFLNERLGIIVKIVRGQCTIKNTIKENTQSTLIESSVFFFFTRRGIVSYMTCPQADAEARQGCRPRRGSIKTGYRSETLCLSSVLLRIGSSTCMSERDPNLSTERVNIRVAEPDIILEH